MKIYIKSKVISVTETERKINIRVDVTTTTRPIKIEKKLIFKKDKLKLVIRNIVKNRSVIIHLPYKQIGLF